MMNDDFKMYCSIEGVKIARRPIGFTSVNLNLSKILNLCLNPKQFDLSKLLNPDPVEWVVE